MLHGEVHWRCVGMIAARLASPKLGTVVAGFLAGAGPVDGLVCVLFALLHDSQRRHDGRDPEHGHRAAAYARALRADGALGLDDRRFAVLEVALELHAGGSVHSDATIGTCWDADRLTLPRVGIAVDPWYLSTPSAHDPAMIEWADGQVSAVQPGWPEILAAFARKGLIW